MVDDGQYYPAMEQLESYQTHRQQNGLPQVNLAIYNADEAFSALSQTELRAKEMMEKTFLTGE